jgi:DnaJ-domain-containing protein 1
MVNFADILERSENPVAAAMLLILSWIASSDGKIAEEEMAELRSIAESGKGSAALRSVIDLAQRCRVEDLQLGCEVLQELEPKHRRLMLQMAIGMALEDGYLTTAEGHIVRFVADVLLQAPSDLNRLFNEMTGEDFPTPADPSSVEWWDSRESRSRQKAQAGRNERRAEPQSGSRTPDVQRLRDLGVLGLDEEATIAQVKDAYKRMAQIHHPDKFVTLGPEAVKAAEVTFLRIRAAYERLMAR